MRCVVVFGLLIAVALCGPNHELMFEEFKREFGRVYEGEEERMRFAAFVSNMKVAEEMSRRNPLATFGVNKFSDVTKEELATYYSGLKYDDDVRENQRPITAQARESSGDLKIDWREKGAVTNVKNQGRCGSCWAFSATGSIEGQWFIAGNPLTSLSEQELVSCDSIDDGCDGGYMTNAFQWLVDNRAGRIVTEASYPYGSSDGSSGDCSSKLNSMPTGAIISDFYYIFPSEDQMALFVSFAGPLSVGVNAEPIQHYTGGIMTNCELGRMNHGMLIVGLDETYNPPYWTLKNTWGASWGEAGYVRLEMWKNLCAITTRPVSSVISSS